jgi:Holliday junction DNA helicase RuvA
LELKDKMKKVNASSKEISIEDVTQSSVYADAVEALMALGYSEKECVSVLKNIDMSDSLEGIIKNSLKQLMN